VWKDIEDWGDLTKEEREHELKQLKARAAQKKAIEMKRFTAAASQFRISCMVRARRPEEDADANA